MGSEKCPICDDHIENSYTTICRHTFCQRCIFEWVKTGSFIEEERDRQRNCPMCRGCIDIQEIRNLFPSEILPLNPVSGEINVANIFTGGDYIYHPEVPELLDIGSLMQLTGSDDIHYRSLFNNQRRTRRTRSTRQS